MCRIGPGTVPGEDGHPKAMMPAISPEEVCLEAGASTAVEGPPSEEVAPLEPRSHHVEQFEHSPAYRIQLM